MADDLISRQAAIKEVGAFASTVIYRGCEEMITGKDSCNPAEWTRGYEKGICDTINIFMGQPAVDAVEVVHGYWTTTDTILGMCCVCSVCGSCPTMEYKYCPYCGAKMDGERREENA